MDIQGLVSAFHTITALPVPGKGCENVEDSLPWFPWVGFTIGVILAGIAYGGCADWIHPQIRLFWVFILAALIVVAWALLTRGFHLDGLADMCDGFGGGWTRERILEIMRDSRIGSFGVIALILALLLKVLGVAMLLSTGRWLCLAVVPIFARWAMVSQAAFNDYARRDVTKVSMANHIIDKTQAKHFLGATFHALIALGLLVWLTNFSVVLIGILGVTALLVTAIVSFLSRNKIGGVTGDILGANCELVEIATLIVAGIII